MNIFTVQPLIELTKKFECKLCNMTFTEQIRLERHINKAHKKKYDPTYRDHLWYAAGAGSGYV